jgi:hypothetical protein
LPDELLPNCIVQLTEANSKSSPIVNRDLRLVFQYAYLFSYDPASNLFVSGIPYALDTDRQFITCADAAFSRNDQSFPVPPGDIEEIIAVILPPNGSPHDYLRDQFDSVQEGAAVLINEPDEGIDRVVLNAEGFLMNGHQRELLQN